MLYILKNRINPNEHVRTEKNNGIYQYAIGKKIEKPNFPSHNFKLPDFYESIFFIPNVL